MSALAQDGGTVRPSAWKQRDDGSWWAADEHGTARLIEAFNPLADATPMYGPRSARSAAQKT